MRILRSPLVSDAYESGLVQGGPPPGANNDRRQARGYYLCDNIAELRAIETEKRNEEEYPMAVLLGQDVKYDGLLQGLYFYVPEGSQNDNSDDGASWVIVNDGRSAWTKLT
jgi:hypothetical protein